MNEKKPVKGRGKIKKTAGGQAQISRNTNRKAPSENKADKNPKAHTNASDNKRIRQSGKPKFTLVSLLFITTVVTVIIALVLVFALLVLSLKGGDDGESTSASNTTDIATSATGEESTTSPEKSTTATAPETTAENTPVISPAVLAETPDAGQEYIDSIIFLGDSRTYGLKAYKMLRDGKETTQVWTPLSGTLTINAVSTKKIYYPAMDSEVLISEAAADAEPKLMVISLGFNYASGALSKDKQQTYFINEYSKLIDIIKENSPETIIILQSLYPVYSPMYDAINNEMVNERNAWILETAESKGVYYLDTQSVLRDENGDLPEKYQNGDGYHPNEAGYKIILDYIKTHAVPEWTASGS